MTGASVALASLAFALVVLLLGGLAGRLLLSWLERRRIRREWGERGARPPVLQRAPGRTGRSRLGGAPRGVPGNLT